MAKDHRRRDWRVFLTARALSLTGSSFTGLVLPVVLFERTNSPLLTALAASAASAAYIAFSMISGYVADTADRKRVLYTSEFASIAAVLAMIALLHADVAVGLILLPLLVLQIVSVFFDSSSAGVAPALVDKDQVPSAVARLAAMATLIETVAPAVGGLLLVVLSATEILAIDAGTFLLSALLLMSIRSPLSRHLAGRTGAPQGASDRLRFALEGARFIRQSPLLLATTGCMAAQSLIIAAYLGQLAPLVAKRVDTLGAGVGMVLAALAAGAFLGSLVVPWLMRRFPGQRILVGTSLAITASAVAILSTRTYAVLVAATFLWAVAAACGQVMLSTLRVQLAPGDMVGRVVAFGRLVSWAVPALVGGVVAGVIATATTPEIGVAAVGIAALLIVAYGLVRLRRVSREADTAVGAG